MSNTDNKEPTTTKNKSRPKLANTAKIVVAVLLVVLMLPTMSMVWVKDSRQDPGYCASCHQDPYYTSWNDPSLHLLAQKHAAAGLSCQSCHDRSLGETTSEIVKYVTGDYYYPLEELELSMDTCFVCHESYEKVIDQTAVEITGGERNPHAGHWGVLECNECHNMHRESVDYCAQCHNPTTDDPGWVVGSESE
jgi:hypothetical protein